MIVDDLLRRLRYQGLCLSVNLNKTLAVLFTKNRNLNEFVKPTLFGIELELQNQVNFGV
jgi:hypothetical protein